MGKLVEVRSPEGELLRYVEVDEKEIQPRRSKAKVNADLKENNNQPHVQMPPKTEKNKKGKAVYPEWLHKIRKEAYMKARKEGKEYYEADHEGRLALVKAWEERNGRDSLLNALDELNENSLLS